MSTIHPAKGHARFRIDVVSLNQHIRIDKSAIAHAIRPDPLE
jgi:hypothetical protein